jgi:addiction module HigA family antidote
VSELAKILGVSRKTVSKIINERGSISADMALRLSKAFNTTPQLWLNLQQNYDLWHAVQDSAHWRKVRAVAA